MGNFLDVIDQLYDFMNIEFSGGDYSFTFWQVILVTVVVGNGLYIIANIMDPE